MADQQTPPGRGGRGVAVYLGLGSNVGDRAAHLAHALAALRALGRVTGVSGVYETEPQGYTEQSPFLNLVVRLETALEPAGVLAATRKIERERGRERSFRNAPRTLDIDILLFGDRIHEGQGLTIPHPRMRDRAFVLVPLTELDRDAVDPRSGTRYRDDLAAFPELPVRRLMDGEELLHDAAT